MYSQRIVTWKHLSHCTAQLDSLSFGKCNSDLILLGKLKLGKFSPSGHLLWEVTLSKVWGKTIKLGDAPSLTLLVVLKVFVSLTAHRETGSLQGSALWASATEMGVNTIICFRQLTLKAMKSWLTSAGICYDSITRVFLHRMRRNWNIAIRLIQCQGFCEIFARQLQHYCVVNVEVCKY